MCNNRGDVIVGITYVITVIQVRVAVKDIEHNLIHIVDEIGVRLSVDVLK